MVDEPLQALIRALSEGSPREAWRLAQVLQLLGRLRWRQPATLTAVIRLTGHADRPVRAAAAAALLHASPGLRHQRELLQRRAERESDPGVKALLTKLLAR